MRTLGYARTSTDDGRQELSLSDQKARLVEAGAVEVFEDELSGKNVDRPALAALLAAAKKGDTILVTRSDRLSRRIVDTFTLIENLERRRIRVVSLSEGLLAQQTSDETLNLGFRSVFAQATLKRIRELTKEALARKKARGERVGSVAFGYREVRDVPRKDGRLVGRLVEDEAEQRIIAIVRALRAEGRSSREIVVLLAEREVKGRTGKPLGRTQVRRILERVA